MIIGWLDIISNQKIIKVKLMGKQALLMAN